MLKKLLLASAIAVAGMFSANAAVLTVVDETAAGGHPADENGQMLGTLTYSGGTLVGLNLSGSNVVAVDTDNASLPTVTALFNSTVGLSLSGGTQTGTFPATTTAEYIALKIGEDIAFFHNTSVGTALSLIWYPTDGAGAGFSTAYVYGGGTIATPIPGAALLFGSGLAGLGALMLRRRKQQVQQAS